MISRIALAFLFVVTSHPISNEVPYNFIIWNVGQGLWITWMKDNQCFHFDMGGEISPLKQVQRICSQKKNHVYFSHMDYDHTNFLKKFMRFTPRLCIYYPKPLKKAWMKRVKTCPSINENIVQISSGQKGNDSNAGSQVYLIAGQVLITGDAPISEELKWYKKLPQNLKLLVLGHHGSQTSTSVKLLDWTHPQMAVASARKARYGHPHPKVMNKLQKRRIPLLKTETLGHLFFKLR